MCKGITGSGLHVLCDGKLILRDRSVVVSNSFAIFQLNQVYGVPYKIADPDQCGLLKSRLFLYSALLTQICICTVCRLCEHNTYVARPLPHLHAQCYEHASNTVHLCANWCFQILQYTHSHCMKFGQCRWCR